MHWSWHWSKSQGRLSTEGQTQDISLLKLACTWARAWSDQGNLLFSKQKRSKKNVKKQSYYQTLFQGLNPKHNLGSTW